MQWEEERGKIRKNTIKKENDKRLVSYLIILLRWKIT